VEVVVRARIKVIEAEIEVLEQELARLDPSTQTHSDKLRRLIALQVERRELGGHS